MKRRNNKNNLKCLMFFLIFAIVIAISAYFNPNIQNYINEIFNNTISNKTEISFDLESIPEYDGKPYAVINNNIPDFTEEDYSTESFEIYSKLDRLGRCGVAYANICKETMPADGEERENISVVKPTGWKQAKYNGEYLYNRCHLIGWQLAGENANESNLITGTRYMNVEGMLPFENMVDDYLENKKNKNNHVLYRVTPVFESNNLVANGVQIEAKSVENNGKGICFNVYIYNVQPGIIIDYATGSSKLE